MGTTNPAATVKMPGKTTATIKTSVPTQDQILVPETLLKKRKSAEKEAADKAAARDARKKESKTKREQIFKRAESYVSYYVPAQPKLVFVVRIKGINKIDPKKR